VQARKSVKQHFNPDQNILGLMESFRRMTNDCIRIGLAEDRTSLRSLSLSCYPRLKDYQVPAAYKLCAISKASGILKHCRKLSKTHRLKKPHCHRPTLTTCYGLKVTGGNLRMPGNLEIPLNTYTQHFLSQPEVEVRSASLTPESLTISVRKQVEPVNCSGMVAIDRNLENVTIADTDNQLERCDLSKASAIKSRCRENKRSFLRNDVKVRKIVYGKYGRLERDRVAWLLHNVSANIILRAKLRREAIVMEDLRGIRKLYRRGNGQGSAYRSRMNSWSFGELERQVQYKADWNGIPVIYVRAFGTSARCSMCGHRVLPEENRKLHCPNCNLTIDRDVNAARNILARGLRFKPVGSASEAMVQERAQAAPILKVDADQSTSKLSNEPTS
jgi:putative transposase